MIKDLYSLAMPHALVKEIEDGLGMHQLVHVRRIPKLFMCQCSIPIIFYCIISSNPNGYTSCKTRDQDVVVLVVTLADKASVMAYCLVSWLIV